MKNLLDKQYENLIAAYSNTVYRCLNPKLELRIGGINLKLDHLLKEKGKDFLCILTAYNPKSCVQNPKKNQTSQNQLVINLGKEGYHLLVGENIDPEGHFPVEQTCWVLGMDRNEGVRFAREWGQHALVSYRISVGTELIWVNTSDDPG